MIIQNIVIDIQGSHRLDKILVHDLSMTISSFSMTISLSDYAFVAFCGKRRKIWNSNLDALFLCGGKKHTNVVQFGGKVGKIP